MYLKYDLNTMDPAKLFSKVQQDTGCDKVVIRKEFGLYSEYLQWVRDGKKITTIRYRPNSIDIPDDFELPLFSTQMNGVVKREYVGSIKLREMILKKFGELNTDDAIKDGFSNLDELQSALKNIYGNINSQDYITIYMINIEKS